MYELGYYKSLEDDSGRGDKDEGTSNYIYLSSYGNPVYCGGAIVNPTYLFCTAGPDVNIDELRRFGEYIVRINDEYALLQEFNKSQPINSRMILVCKAILEKVEYSRGEVLDVDPESSGAIKLDYLQKDSRYSWQCEYRYVVQARMINKDSNNNKEEYLEYDFGRRLDYLEII